MNYKHLIFVMKEILGLYVILTYPRNLIWFIWMKLFHRKYVLTWIIEHLQRHAHEILSINTASLPPLSSLSVSHSCYMHLPKNREKADESWRTRGKVGGGETG